MHTSPSARPARYVRLLFVQLLATAVAACSHAPGMTLDSNSDELKARAHIHSINTPTLQQLQVMRSQPVDEAARPPSFARSDARYDYLVAPQDVLRITVWNQPELTNPANTTTELSGRVVNSDGMMFFPYVGSFKAEGLSVQQIRKLVIKGLSRVIKAPQVDVAVLQYRGQRVYVSGEVKTPGSVPVTDVPPDLAEVVARSGGFGADADLTAVTVTRGADTLRVNLQALYYNGDSRSNLRLRHGDIVNVPERRSARVFVTGEVLRQAALPMPRGDMTLADALADAGGVNPLSANAGQVFVIRASTDPKPHVYHLNAAAPDALLLADKFVLQARDVVYVDTASVVRWSRFINNVLPSANYLRDTWTDNRILR